ncbi:MAG: isocitrate/isopropylmalate dehydrogenase family protein, partial [Dehalococcoidales bacterium]|nr:isocitrate/isopropylmalate dehydrogenase family protein [Dehalococcoidales bacterium]
AQMLSGVMMLKHLKENEAAERIEKAIAAVVREGKSITYDLLPEERRNQAVGTSQVADAIIEKLG